MKLRSYILIRFSWALTIILIGWAVFFYIAVMDEVNDEVDDSLEDYSELIIIRALAGEELPSKNSGSNNQYFLKEISPEYAEMNDDIRYKDSMVYIAEKQEKEPARILTTIFKDDNNQFFELTVATPSIEKNDLKRAITGWMIFLYVILLLIIISITVWVFFRNMRPLYILLHWLDTYRIGTKNSPLKNETKVTEFRKLNEEVVRFAERSEQMFEQQKQFISNASHEMQTPLAVIQSRIEMLMEDETLSEWQLEELMKTHQTLKYITRVNKSLLLLSKIENGQFSETTDIEVNGLLKDYLADYEEAYAYRHIKVEIINEGICHFNMNETLSSMLFTNLLRNSFIHNVDNGHIRIVITEQNVTFCNSGIEKPLDTTRIFERFYQEKKKEGSTGLGLAIVHSICKIQSLGLRYYYKDNEHCFEVTPSR